ncbi:MAG: methylmalonyl Co-A mutase-associated GTPase MeaB [Thermoplasmata archaeon]|jgi:LAO/AO transport system kinase|nr:methylmalonyl Co-A mutase-associated GTPase MeaB [Thermoplasmata archaeon]MVT13267.1 methylmalonyl Co-A mutase-associated GTPase MeaB [Euryarchaeota archaeon]MVT14748.1 methylmalonyl Co-A mutase-associated GTPase MeaB [Euryarchaeota archaeon]MVT35988.1 methylmalonyl Co-A mutase-associated GTPase MeaB [Euryarchaeota archaeon]
MNIDEIMSDRKKIAKAISEVENGNTLIATEALRRIRGIDVIGVTGVPGSGKSTLISKIAYKMAKEGKKIAIIGIDPTSPFSGGAVLGDRIRMKELNRFDNVFIRSISTGGKLGGMSYHTPDVINILDAAGFDLIFLETVGTGQDEVDVMNIATTIMVVLVPTLGDEVQVIKAGQLEIGDIFVVNKADQGAADEKIKEMTLILKERKDGWIPKIMKSVAVTNQGIDEIIRALDEHKNFIIEKGIKNKKIMERMLYTIKQYALERIENIMYNENIEKYINQIKDGKDISRIIDEIMLEMGVNYGKGREIYRKVEGMGGEGP